MIGGFGFGAAGVAYLAHIGGFITGLATGYFYKKTHQSEFMYGSRYGSRYGWKGDS
jgi:membrane associated rhomboid family serine protease